MWYNFLGFFKAVKPSEGKVTSFDFMKAVGTMQKVKRGGLFIRKKIKFSKFSLILKNHTIFSDNLIRYIIWRKPEFNIVQM